ncbi:shikimate dehydrogenase [Bacillus salitolerans]|uniref:Shikimate dehydrogenase (NADP(+)) n=1 Tax=Bacillus salitolerans TaxID=1437434 RepID=A0ABW4LR83_9BACI
MERLYGVIGDPILHSMSPIMHNMAFEMLGLHARYLAFHVTPQKLPGAIEAMRALGIQGFNVTVPHKVNVMNYLDEIDELAIKIGAVNTIVNRNGKLVGYNTDGIGYVTGLRGVVTGRDITQLSILIIGAGGASRAIYYSLIHNGAQKVDIANRTLEKAKNIITTKHQLASKAINIHEAVTNLAEYDIIINTTSIGMSPNIEEVPIEINNISNKHIVSDIIYNPLETKFLKLAKQAGAVTQNGVDMFVFQGALSFEMWTGIYPDVHEMRKTIMDKLGGA